MKAIKISIILLSILIGSCKNNPDTASMVNTETDKPATVTMLANNELRYIELSGTPYERGLTHGRLLKKEIKEVTDLLKEDIKQGTGQNPDDYITSFLERTEFDKSISKWTAELLEEVRGISEGSEIDYNTILMHQLGDEYWIDRMALQVHKCSSIGVNKTSNNPSITAQNMDIPEFYHGYQTVIKITEASGKQVMLLTIPGHLGITGMNYNEISVNVNTLLQLENSTSGLPVTFIIRGLLAKNDQAEALKFLKEVKHASGQNYIIGGPEKVYDFECSANDKVEFRPFENSEFTYHTNHPLANTDYSKIMLEGLEIFGGSIEQTVVCQRFSSFEKRFNTETMGISVDDIKEVLSSRENESQDVISNRNTYASVIYKLAETPEFIIAPGKPHEVEYVTITFE